MSAHTPGPWEVSCRSLANGNRAISANGGKDPIANVHAFANDPAHDLDPGFLALRARCEANAALIAAAPLMLEALEELLSVVPVLPNAAKALVGMEARYERAIVNANAAIAAAKGDAA